MPGILNAPSNAIAYLQLWSNTFKIDYIPAVADLTRRFGKTTTLIPKSKRTLNGNRAEYEFLARPNNGVQATYALMDPQPQHAPGQYGRFQVVFDHTDASLNDFMKLDLGFRTTWYEIQKRMDSNWKDQIANYIERDVKQGIEGVKETFARSFHLPSDGALGTIATSGKKNADSDLFAYATTYTSGSAVGLLKLDATSMQRIGDGQRIEIRTSAGVLRANNLIVEYVHWGDFTVRVRVATSSHSPGPSVDSGGTTVTNLNAIVATDKIYLNGSYNVIPKMNLANYFSPSTAFFGKARLSDENYAMLMPQRLDASNGSGTATALTPDMIRKAGRMAAWTSGDGTALVRRVMVSAEDQWIAASRFGQDQTMIFTPALESEIGKEYNKAFGFNGIVFHDPNFGSIMWTIDDFASYGVLDFLNLENWEYLAPFGDGGFSMLDGQIGYWTQNTENDGSGQPSLVYSARGMQHYCFVPTKPKEDVRIFNLSSPT